MRLFYYAIDIGKYVDSFVVCMLEKIVDGNGWTLNQRICKEMIPGKGRPLDFQDDQMPVIEALFKNWMPVKAYVDRTGMGEGMAEQLQKKYGNVVEGVHVTAAVKDLIFQNLREMLRLNRIRMLNIPRQREQIVSMVREQALTGSVSYHPPAEGMHDDIAFALALACWAAREEPQGFTVMKPMETKPMF